MSAPEQSVQHDLTVVYRGIVHYTTIDNTLAVLDGYSSTSFSFRQATTSRMTAAVGRDGRSDVSQTQQDRLGVNMRAVTCLTRQIVQQNAIQLRQFVQVLQASYQSRF